MTLLEVEDLHVSFNTADGIVQAVRGVSYQIDAGQTLGIVGESGSGKSVSTQTITGLTRGAKISGRALFEGQDLLTASPDQMRGIRGAKIGMIFQDPLSSLHPYYRVGWQIIEMIRLHDHEMSKAQAKQRAVELLGLVGIPQPERRVDDYPHQFSGGMRQRAMIAMAMALNPALLIADEPTTALDVTVQAQVLRVIRRMQELVFSPCCSGTEERSYKHFCVAQLSRNGIPRTRRVRGATQKCIFDVNGIGKRPV